jgi:hypothetical protein
MKMRLKGCRKCGGDLVPDGSDRDGLTMSCLQCGQEMHLRPVGGQFRLAMAPLPPAAYSQPRAA